MLPGAPEIPPFNVLWYMGIDIYLQSTPTAPRKLPEFQAAMWKQVLPQRLTVDGAMMVLMAILPSKLLPLASVYHVPRPMCMPRTTPQWWYKHMMETSRYAHMDATLQTHRALRGGCPAMPTPGQYTHHPWCPRLLRTLQRVVDEVFQPMGMPGRCSGNSPILVRAPAGRQRRGCRPVPPRWRCTTPNTAASRK